MTSSAWLRAVGLFLLAVPFLPLERWFGPIRGTTFLAEPGEWLFGILLFGTGAWFLAALLFRARSERTPGPLERLPSLGDRRWVRGLLAAGLAVLLALASRYVFHGRPLLVDSVVQLFQARIFAAGSLAAPAPPGTGFFLIQNLVVDGDRWFSQYPPGHAAWLVPGVLVGIPWLVPILLSLGSAALLSDVARRVYGEREAGLTLALLVLCPFFWFMGASFMNHVSALFCGALALWCLVRWDGGSSGAALVGSGAALGALLLSRPLTAVAIGAALGPGAVWRAWTRGQRRALAAAVLAFLSVGGLYLAYNAATTGDPFLPGYIRLWGSHHGLGFHETPWGDVHSPLAGLRNELTDLALLNVYLFEWPIPALMPVALFLLLGLARAPWDRRLLLGFLALPAAYFLYWHRDAYLGPRFLYESLVFLVPLTARSLSALAERLRRIELPGRSLLLPPHLGAPALLLLLLSATYAAAYSVPRRFHVYAAGLASMKEDLGAVLDEEGVSEGLVFVAVSFGNRLVSRLRDLGVPAATVERAYRTLDHCDLHLLERRARAERWDADRLRRVLDESARTAPRTVTSPEWNGDGTLRARPDRPWSPSCREEVSYDRAGYTLYTPHLLRNAPDLRGPIVVARDLREENRKLARRYPGRNLYLYRGRGRLERLR